MKDRKVPVVINLATGNYVKGQERLDRSLVADRPFEKRFWQDEEQIGAPKHKENPYAFKLYGFSSAINQGFKHILWVDASVFAVKNIDPVFEVIADEGYIMQAAGHKAGTWANDRCLEYFGITRDEAMEIDMYGNAGFLGLNMNAEIAQDFLREWYVAMKAGIFKGGWRNDDLSESKDPRCKGHRHDMVVGSIIAHKLGMEYKRGDEWLQYAAPREPVRNQTIVFKAQGVA